MTVFLSGVLFAIVGAVINAAIAFALAKIVIRMFLDKTE